PPIEAVPRVASRASAKSGRAPRVRARRRTRIPSMNDSLQPPAPEPTPFGAGIPAEAVEPVRLPPGLAHGPALDVRGHAAAREAQVEPRPAPAAVTPQPEHAPASQWAGQPVAAPIFAAASGTGPSTASAGSAPTRVEP